MQFPFLSKHNVFLCPFHFLNHEQSIPTKTLSQFTKTRSLSNWMLLCENFKKTEWMKKSFAGIGASIWNSIPYTLLNLLVNTSSETKLNKYFLKLKSLRMTILKSLNCSIKFVFIFPPPWLAFKYVIKGGKFFFPFCIPVIGVCNCCCIWTMWYKLLLLLYFWNS